MHSQAPSRRKKFNEMCPDLALPPEPIITRWCTWIKAAIYYCENFPAVKSVVDSFDEGDAEAIRTAQELFANRSVKNDLAFIKSHFAQLVSITIKLETQGLPLNESVGMITSIRASLNSLAQQEFGQKLDRVLQRNPGFKIIADINNVLNHRKRPNEQFVKDLSPNELVLYQYCPTTSADVERSFSMYGNVLTDRRRRFLFENLKQHLIVLCNREEK